jgi:hypothetical protein
MGVIFGHALLVTFRSRLATTQLAATTATRAWASTIGVAADAEGPALPEQPFGISTENCPCFVKLHYSWVFGSQALEYSDQ